MYFIGDIHGNFKTYEDIIVKYPHDKSMQVGDMGIGWPGDKQFPNNSFPEQHRFIRGNHDNPSVCAELPECIWDFEYSQGTLYIAGGYSRDKRARTEGVDYWSNEELSVRDLSVIIDLAIHFKPHRIVSHEAPVSLIEILYPGLDSKSSSRTALALDTIWKHHKPYEWVFGHYHMSKHAQIGTTHIYSLGIAEVLWLD
jgi:hypothetical protein